MYAVTIADGTLYIHREVVIPRTKESRDWLTANHINRNSWSHKVETKNAVLTMVMMSGPPQPMWTPESASLVPDPDAELELLVVLPTSEEKNLNIFDK